MRTRLQGESAFHFEQIGVVDVLEGRLRLAVHGKDGALEEEGFTLLCVPGGFAQHYRNALGEEGRARIEAFVSSGGGFVGLCAGAFLGSRWGYGLLNVSIQDPYTWRRGRGDCEMRYTAVGQRISGGINGSVVGTRYCNGPLFRLPKGNSSAAMHEKIHTLAKFQTSFWPRRPVEKKDDGTRVNMYSASDGAGNTELDHTGATVRAGRLNVRLKGCAWEKVDSTTTPVSSMRGSAAIVSGFRDHGRVVLVSVHLEDGDRVTREQFRNLFRWASKSDCMAHQ